MFAANAVVLITAVVVLALSPATVSFPIGPLQATVLGVGLVVMLVVDLVLLRRILSPFAQLVRAMGSVDPLRPGHRIDFTGQDPDLAELARAFNAMAGRLEDERRQAGRRLLSAQESERRRLSRDLHDEVGQLLTAALLELDGAAALPPGEVAPALAEARTTVEQALDAVRAVVRELRPVALDDLGLSDALAVLGATVARSSGLPVRRRIAEEVSELSADEELAVYRVAQAGLTNAMRHAAAREIDLSLEAVNGGVRLRVADDGRGYEGGENAGIRGMRERAHSVGGDLEIRPRAGGGTEVVLDLRSGGRP